jgi:hypothetical protein
MLNLNKYSLHYKKNKKLLNSLANHAFNQLSLWKQAHIVENAATNVMIIYELKCFGLVTTLMLDSSKN